MNQPPPEQAAPVREPVFLVLLREELTESIEHYRPVTSLNEGIGLIVLALSGLLSEARLEPAEQDGEKLIEGLLTIAAQCARTAEAVVLPELSRD